MKRIITPATSSATYTKLPKRSAPDKPNPPPPRFKIQNRIISAKTIGPSKPKKKAKYAKKPIEGGF